MTCAVYLKGSRLRCDCGVTAEAASPEEALALADTHLRDDMSRFEAEHDLLGCGPLALSRQELTGYGAP